MGKSVVRRAHRTRHRQLAGKTDDAVADLRVDGPERSLLQRQGRELQFGRMEGNKDGENGQGRRGSKLDFRYCLTLTREERWRNYRTGW